MGVSMSLISSANANEEPQLNPNPKYFLTITGNIAPELKDEVSLSFFQTYGGYSEACIKTVNWLEGVKGSPSKEDTYSAILDSTGYYSLKIPLDKYLPGKCGWVPFSLSYNFQLKNHPISTPEALANFDDKNQQYEKYNPSEYNLICSKNLAHCSIDIARGTSMALFFLPDQSVTLIFNVKINKG